MSAQSIRRLSSLTSGSSDPLLTQQRSKLDNENDDEHEHDLGSKAINDNPGLPLLVVLAIVLVLVIDSRHKASVACLRSRPRAVTCF